MQETQSMYEVAEVRMKFSSVKAQREGVSLGIGLVRR